MLGKALAGKRILVLGASGRVGRLLSPFIDDAVPSESVLKPPHSQFDLPADTEKLPLGQDVVLCLAAIVRPGEADKNPQRTLDLNLVTVDRLIHHYTGAPDGCRVILASTVRTSATSSMYAWSKIGAEALVASAGRIGHPHVTVVRFGNLIEAAPVIEGLVASILGRSEGFVRETTEYFQTTVSAAAEIALALSPQTSSGSVITPVLPRIPVPLLAGFFSGYALARGHSISNWAPRYERSIDHPDPIPEWWWPFTRLEQVAVKRTDASQRRMKLNFLVTSFKEDAQNAKQGQEIRKPQSHVRRLRKKVEELGRPRLGAFIESLQVADRFNQDR